MIRDDRHAADGAPCGSRGTMSKRAKWTPTDGSANVDGENCASAVRRAASSATSASVVSVLWRICTTREALAIGQRVQARFQGSFDISDSMRGSGTSHIAATAM